MIDAIVQAITDFADWLFNLVEGAFLALVDWIHDAFVWGFDSVLDAIASGVEAVPVPDWLAAYSLGTLFAQLHPMIGYFVLGLGIPECLAVIAAAFTLRKVRKPLSIILPG